jgi:excisionase family DNA binding protein
MHTETAESLLTPAEVAEWLRVTPATLYRWRYERRGPAAIKMGKYLRFRPADVTTWLEQQRDPSR